jgi:wyosine [tRNA(Phe)-imidazoG37] synthetase (radical SAM superfamily)
MVSDAKALTFGPVPSRRLGQSLGINNIPPKVCTYSCVYCQLGRSLNMRAERKAFYDPEEILSGARHRIDEACKRGEKIDILTFVPDGEPTLDVNLGREIEILKPLGKRIGVISNASLIWQVEVQNDLLKADWVSLKIDAVTEAAWRRLNRPHKAFNLGRILEGIQEFSQRAKGELATETMIVRGVNDTTAEMQKVGDFIAGLSSSKSYISIPTRPPAARWVNQPVEHAINTAYQIFNDKSVNVEYLIGYEGNAFASTGDVESDLLSITSVHPMREDAVRRFLATGGTDWGLVDKLIANGKMIETEYEQKRFYMRRLSDLKMVE